MKRYKPMVDKLFYIICVPTLALMAVLTLISFPSPLALFITVLSDLLVLYFLLSPLFGYVELREECLFIKYGLLLKKKIPYNKIRGVERKRSFYSESMMSLKNSFEHLNIKYNTFDVTSVSVKENGELLAELERRRRQL
ncbi:MAG: PH domain-containing protein [Clostridia bacterium]|nr:PH domain-containing protein [Clostridia bacterium]